MPAHRKNYDHAVAQYARGESIEAVAAACGVTRQTMWKILGRRGVEMRHRDPAPYVYWRGAKYTLRPCGYYGRTTGNRRYLHQDVWEFYSGPIPEGFEVHHLDEDKSNNDISNFELMASAEHAARHGFGGNQYVPSLGRRPVKW